MTSHKNPSLTIRSIGSKGPRLPFELQPIMRLDTGEVFAHELLFRGERSEGIWKVVDRAVLEYFRTKNRRKLPTFINLDHGFLLDTPDSLLLEVMKHNQVYFELSEELVSADVFESVSMKVNRLSAQGITFAIDDFGSGLDGLSRLYALDRVACIKVDGKLFQQAHKRKHARESLRNMVNHWNKSGFLTIAEWVESPDLMAFAMETGFGLAQGFQVDAFLQEQANSEMRKKSEKEAADKQLATTQ